jgi:uncharacterized protein YrrD
MLRSVKELRDYVLAAKDGEIGRCKDFLFDDSAWTIRYMLADTGKWLPKRKVLISPVSVGEGEWKSQLLPVALTKDEIEKSPQIDADAPVSREYEREWHEHYNWAPYWHGTGVWGAEMIPRALAREVAKGTATLEKHELPAHNLRSTREVTGYHIQATDDEIGHVEDFILDDKSWMLRYIVVDTRNWLPGKKVIIPPKWVTRIEWDDRLLHVDVSRDMVKNGPKFDPGAAVNREYEARLYDYYGRPKYWEAE